MSETFSSTPEESLAELSSEASPDRRAQRLFWIALCLLYLAAIIPRLRAADFDEPDITYGDEFWTAGQAADLLSKPDGGINLFHKAPGIPHFLFLTFKPYFWLVKGYYGWESVNDVQWWRARHYWRTINILLGGLSAVLAGVIGMRAFNRKVGLIAAALSTVDRRCAMWLTYLKEEALMTLACTIVVYSAYKLFRDGSSRLRWVLVAGLASGSALAFKYNAAPIVPFFLLALVLSPAAPKGTGQKVPSWISRFRFGSVSLYLMITIGTFLLWFPQLLQRPKEVRTSMLTLNQLASLNILNQKIPSLDRFLSAARDSWNDVFNSPGGVPSFPFYFFVFTTVALVAVPVYAAVRRQGFLLALSSFVWLMWLLVYYQYIFSYWHGYHYFVPAIPATYLLLAYGLDWLCERLAAPIARRTAFPTRRLQLFLLGLLCLWPLAQGYKISLQLIASIRGYSEPRALRSEIVHRLPVGSRIFITQIWRQPYISDSLLDIRRVPSLYANLCAQYTLNDLVREGFDFACVMGDDPTTPVEKPPYRKELGKRAVEPAYVLPAASIWLNSYSYVPIQPNDGESFHLSLYFREPSPGDFAGVHGIVPPSAAPNAERTTQSLLLKARLYNGEKWSPGFIRWEVLVGGKTVWRGRDTTDTRQVSLSLPIRAMSGSRIMIRTMRTDFHPQSIGVCFITPSQEDRTPISPNVSLWRVLTREPSRAFGTALGGWGGPLSDLKIDGLKVIHVSTGRQVPIQWSYTGRNGGPGPARYAMRRDWLDNDSPFALLDTGFEGARPLVESWRPYRIIRPERWSCRRMARIEKAAGLGMDGSSALRFVVGYPARKSATLGIMQPMARPASQQIRRIRMHYCVDGVAGNRGEVALRLAATALALSGEYIDRAEVRAPVVRVPNRWKTLDLNIRDIWKRKHTRVDLIDFLEVAIEATGGPGAVFNCLIDNVEVE
jgi:hypothetical protein